MASFGDFDFMERIAMLKKTAVLLWIIKFSARKNIANFI